MDGLPDHFEQSTLTGFTVAFGTIHYFLLKSQFESRVLEKGVADFGKNRFHLSKTNYSSKLN